MLTVVLCFLQEEMAAEMPNVKFAKLNCTTDAAAKKIAMAQGIKALPTFHLFRNNEKVGTFVGGKPTALRKFLAEQVN
jgi:thioredoxin-like negative regulator of GroEL